MSSNQNNSQRRIGSIKRRIASRVIRNKIKISLGCDFLIFLFAICAYLVAMDIGTIGEIDFQKYNRSVTYERKARYENSLHNIESAQSLKEVLDAVREYDGILVYRVSSKATGEVLINTGVFCMLTMTLAGVIGLFIIQIMCHLMSIPLEYNKIRHILRPIDELAIKADEIARFDFSENKYQLIEDKISSIAPDEEMTISLGDEDLAGIEGAMNNLIARIRESNRQQARFVNDASHELRTPIAVIQGYANMLSRWGREDEKVLDESITAIKNESDNMKHLVEQLLFLARGDAGRTNVEKKAISINEIAREVYEESLMIDENHVYKLISSDDAYIMADEGLIKQAIRILIDNAAKYTKQKDEIRISTGKSDGRCYIQVQDAGIGMNEEDVQHMFERFYRASEARSYDGTGLGLSIAKWIIDKHNGHFEIVSREGLGTRIGVYIDEYTAEAI